MINLSSSHRSFCITMSKKMTDDNTFFLLFLHYPNSSMRADSQQTIETRKCPWNSEYYKTFFGDGLVVTNLIFEIQVCITCIQNMEECRK